MISLNLLPPALKKDLRARVMHAALERLMLTATILTLCGVVLLHFIRLRLRVVLQDVQNRQILSAEYVTANNETRNLNALIARIEALQRLQISPSALLLDFAGRTPRGIGLTSLDFDIGSESMRLSGVAARREDLLAYEEAIKKSPFVKKFDSPISNLFQKANVNFQFRIVLNVPELGKVFVPQP